MRLRSSGQGREEQAAFRALIDRLRAYFLTQDGKPRGERFAGTGFNADGLRHATTRGSGIGRRRRRSRRRWPTRSAASGAI